MAKISAYVPEPSLQYNVQNQRQILEAINTIKDQLNFGYQQDLVNEQAAFLQFMYGNQSGVFNPAYAIPGNIPYYLAVAQGLIPNTSQVNIFAFSDSVKTTFYTLWELTGTTQYAFPASAVTMTLASTSALDNTRATILINGLDSSWNQISETIALNGTSNVTTVNSYLRINSMIMTSTGTGQTTNVGTITAKNSGITYSVISIGISRSQAAVYSVPNGYTMYITSINAFNGDAAAGNAINYQVKTTNNAQTNPVTLTVLQTAWDQRYQVIRNNPFPYTQKIDIQWQYSTASGTHSVGIILQGLLVKN
jgi:hypothetical protein